MRLRLITILIAALAVLAAPALASASPSGHPSPTLLNGIPINEVLIVQQGSAMAEVHSMSSVPLHFTASAGRAVQAAEQTQTMQAFHRRVHPLRVFPYVWRAVHPYWYIIFEFQNKIVATANVSPGGRVIGIWTGRQAAPFFAHGGWSWSVTSRGGAP